MAQIKNHFTDNLHLNHKEFLQSPIIKMKMINNRMKLYLKRLPSQLSLLAHLIIKNQIFKFSLIINKSNKIKLMQKMIKNKFSLINFKIIFQLIVSSCMISYKNLNKKIKIFYMKNAAKNMTI